MPCTTAPTLTELQKAAQRAALDRLQKALAMGTVSAVIGAAGGIALRGWAVEDRAGISDLCAYRALANTPEMRRAVMRAEAMAGRKLSLVAVGSGLHSHDGGATWSRH